MDWLVRLLFDLIIWCGAGGGDKACQQNSCLQSDKQNAGFRWFHDSNSLATFVCTTTSAGQPILTVLQSYCAKVAAQRDACHSRSPAGSNRVRAFGAQFVVTWITE